MTTAIDPIEVARIKWLRLLTPQLWAGGFTELAARYEVELERLERLTDSQGRRLVDVANGDYDDCDIACTAGDHDRSCPRYGS